MDNIIKQYMENKHDIHVYGLPEYIEKEIYRSLFLFNEKCDIQADGLVVEYLTNVHTYEELRQNALLISDGINLSYPQELRSEAVEVFMGEQLGINDINVFIDQKNLRTVICSKQMVVTTDTFKVITGIFPKILSWYFGLSNFNEENKECVKKYMMNYFSNEREKYQAALDIVKKTYEESGIKKEAALLGMRELGREFYTAQIRSIDRNIEDRRRYIKDLIRDYQRHLQDIEDFKVRRLGLLANGSKDNVIDSIIEFVDNCDDIEIREVNTAVSSIRFDICTRMELWNDSDANVMVENKNSEYYTGAIRGWGLTSDTKTKDALEYLWRKILIDKEIELNTCGVTWLDIKELSCGVIAGMSDMENIELKDAHPGYIFNPHVTYNCIDEYAMEATQYIEAGRFDAALNAMLMAFKSFSLGDGPCVDRLCELMRERCLMIDGQLMNGAQAVYYIKNNILNNSITDMEDDAEIAEPLF